VPEFATGSQRTQQTTTTKGAQVAGPRADKVAVVEEVRDHLERADAAILTEYRGLKVADLATLRRALREVGAEYKIYKNTLVRRATSDTRHAVIEPMLLGPTAIAFVESDVASVAKVLRDFARTHPALVVKGSFVGSDLLDARTTTALADLPSRPMLLSQIAGAFAAPMRQFASLLKALPQNFAYGLSAVIDQRVAGGEALPEAPAADAGADSGADGAGADSGADGAGAASGGETSAGLDASAAPEQEAASQPEGVAEPAPEPELEAAASEPELEAAASEPELEAAESEPELEAAAPEPELEAAEPEQAAEPEAAAEPEPEPEAAAEPEAAGGAEPEAAEPEPEGAAEPEPESAAEPEAAAEPVAADTAAEEPPAETEAAVDEAEAEVSSPSASSDAPTDAPSDASTDHDTE
jgi:large subunit ribosomal protein L10